MDCQKHPEKEASFFCSNCGIALCQDCVKTEGSRVLCEKCLPVALTESGQATIPNQLPPENDARPNVLHVKGDPYCSPGVAFALGLIPGVGAICNGELLKGFIHVLIFGSLISLTGSDEVAGLSPLFGVLAGAFYLYMPLEAYHTARKRVMALRGIQVITPFEAFQFSNFWAGATAILFGTLFLVNQFVPGAIAFVLRGWPIVLILIGVYNLTRHFGIASPKRGTS
jgi:hypothetical protein